MELLSLFGAFEILPKYLALRRVHDEIAQRWIDDPPDVFIGIDAPAFNTSLEYRLKAAGIRTAHYVSPTVWAWRPGRIHRIREAVDLMLCIFPFEPEIYREHGVDAKFVGHPMANDIPMENDAVAARQRLGIDPNGEWMAILPGSRSSEIRHLAQPFIRAAALCRSQRPGLRFLVPMVNEARRFEFEQALLATGEELPLTIVDGQSRDVIAAADVVLLASGTATLEAALVKRPMVVGYRVNTLTYRLVRRMMLIEHFSQPNILAGEPLVPELIQDALQPEELSRNLLYWLENPDEVSALKARFTEMHEQLRLDADTVAASALLNLWTPTA